MFGYVKPVKAELKVREYELFRASYCGLCHTLGKRYGFLWRFLLNYDFCYLAILLQGAADSPCTYCSRRCIASPLRKRQTLAETAALDYSADATVLLSWYKAADAVCDEHGLKKLLWRLARFCMKRGYRRASRSRPRLDAVFAENMHKLNELEQRNTPSLDRTADLFAGMLAEASGEGQGNQRRILREALYHTGRWVYIADAWDDVTEDLEKGEYNPVVSRFRLSEPPTGEIAGRLKETLELSCAAAAQAIEFLPQNAFTDIARNVVYLGMPSVVKAIGDGVYHEKSRKKRGITHQSGRNTKHGSL